MIIQSTYSVYNTIFTLIKHQVMEFGIFVSNNLFDRHILLHILITKDWLQENKVHAQETRRDVSVLPFCISEDSGTVYPTDKVLLNPICALKAGMAD